jgi:hypothetical protein
MSTHMTHLGVWQLALCFSGRYWPPLTSHVPTKTGHREAQTCQPWLEAGEWPARGEYVGPGRRMMQYSKRTPLWPPSTCCGQVGAFVGPVQGCGACLAGRASPRKRLGGDESEGGPRHAPPRPAAARHALAARSAVVRRRYGGVRRHGGGGTPGRAHQAGDHSG